MYMYMYNINNHYVIHKRQIYFSQIRVFLGSEQVPSVRDSCFTIDAFEGYRCYM